MRVRVAAVVLVFAGLQGDQSGKHIARLNQQLASQGPLVELVTIFTAGKGVVVVTVVLVIERGEPARHAFAEPAANRALQLGTATVSEAGFHIAIHFLAGFGCHVVHESACGVASEQRALWPAQHFGALEVEELEIEPGQVGFVHLIHVDGGGTFVVLGKVDEADTADAHNGDVALAEVLRHLQPGCLRGHLETAVEPQLPHGVSGERGG